MTWVMMSVRDAKSDAYGRPFFVQTVGAGIRSFDDEVNRAQEDNMLFHHPEDFALWQLGHFHDHDGTFEIITPKLLVQADQVKKGQLHQISKV